MIRTAVLVGMVGLLVCRVGAQSPPIPPPPPPDLSLTPPPDLPTVVTLGFSNRPAVRTRSVQGHHPLVALNLHEHINVDVQFTPDCAGAQLIVHSLDGGEATVLKPDTTVAADGTSRFQFTGGDKPGLYRLVVTAGRNSSMLEFWVADPKNPAANPPAIGAAR